MAKKKTTTQQVGHEQPAHKEKRSLKLAMQRASKKTYGGIRSFLERHADENYASFSMAKKHHRPLVPKLERPFQFVGVVAKTLWRFKKLWLVFIVFTALLSFLLIGFTQQSNYAQVTETVDLVGESLKGTVFEQIPSGVILVTSTLSGALGGNMTESQQIISTFFYFFMGLVVIWLLRQLLAGNKVRFRDGLYNAGAPVVPMVVLTIVLMLQLLPVALLLMAYTTALSQQILDGGIETAAFTLAVIFAVLLTFYFITTTVFAYMVSTVPGIYPLQAYASARQLIAGQRLRMLARLLLLLAVIAVLWVSATAGAVALASWINQPTWPIVPIILQILTAVSIIYGVGYCYLLYRRMINEPDYQK